MEDRYEIRNKIGQGGLGTIYRAYDTRMNREVAIKRIPNIAEDPTHQEESTRQLLKEARALASLQHPHIVTVYDVGADEDGPYLVLELISGKTLDEIIENAPLTWTDFRELALQTQEALIAAQELHIIHADIKPSNLMLGWLPSGKFQVKVVDFGLATLAHSQTKQELEALTSVYGSIFFMAPEQFERLPIDARTDLYAMACVYYQALTGMYPFDGETGVEVMNAHLNHEIIPIQDVRSNIPIWLCDWIMWNLNRFPDDRPASAREALMVFLQNDQIPDPPLSLGLHLPIKRPAFTSRLAGPKTVRLARPSSVPPATQEPPANNENAPQPLMPPKGSKPSVHTSSHALPQPTPTTALQSATAATPKSLSPPGTRGIGRIVKIASGVLIALILGMGLFKFVGDKINSHTLAPLLAQATLAGTTEIRADAASIKLLLASATRPEQPDYLAVLKALSLAKASDSSDVDAMIQDFTLKDAALSAGVQEALIRDVIEKRRNPLAVPGLLEYAKSNNNPHLAATALKAVRATAGEAHFKQLVGYVQSHSSDEVRTAAELALAEIISRSSQPSGLAAQLDVAYINTSSLKARNAILRLLARCGNDQTLRLINDYLAGSDLESKLAAITALGYWPDEAVFPSLIEQINLAPDSSQRSLALDAALMFLAAPPRAGDSGLLESLWATLTPLVNSPEDLKKSILLLESLESYPWATAALEAYSRDPTIDPAARQLATEVLARHVQNQ